MVIPKVPNLLLLIISMLINVTLEFLSNFRMFSRNGLVGVADFLSYFTTATTLHMYLIFDTETQVFA